MVDLSQIDKREGEINGERTRGAEGPNAITEICLSASQKGYFDKEKKRDEWKKSLVPSWFREKSQKESFDCVYLCMYTSIGLWIFHPFSYIISLSLVFCLVPR